MSVSGCTVYWDGNKDFFNGLLQGRDSRDGYVHRFSTPSQAGHSGTGRLMQVNSILMQYREALSLFTIWHQLFSYCFRLRTNVLLLQQDSAV